LHEFDDGQRIFATERELHFLDASGATVRTEPNGGPLALVTPHKAAPELNTLILCGGSLQHGVDLFANIKERPTLIGKTADDELIELYIKVNQFEESKQAARETRQVWSIFKEMTHNRALKNCDRNDGRALAKYFADRGDKSATVKKKVGRVCAAVNLAIKEGKLTFNPFSGVATLKDDATKRVQLDEAEITLALANLDKFSKSDALLFRLLAATGMRPGEPFEIEGEKIEKGVRYVVVGTKTKQSKRRVPLPASVLPHLPGKIRSALFTEDQNKVLPRLNKWLRELGIDGEGKCVYSLRHRAKDELRAAECPRRSSPKSFSAVARLPSATVTGAASLS
jgi:integrase